MTDEKKFEKQVIAYYRKKGAIAEHLGGPEGWPDVTVFRSIGTYMMIELKSCKRKNFADIDPRALMEKSQIAFFAAHPKHDFMVMIKCKDGIYHAEFRGKDWSDFKNSFIWCGDFD